MDNLNEYLFNADGSTKTAEELVSAADDTSVALFVKIAAASGEDVTALNEDEQTLRYVEVMSKVAEECASDGDKKEEDKEKEKKAAAIAEELSQRAKVAEVQAAGVQMGQAAWSVIQAGLDGYFSKEKTAARQLNIDFPAQTATDKVRRFFGKAKDAVTDAASDTSKAVSGAAKHVGGFAKNHKGKLLAGGATVATGGAGYAGYKHLKKDKTASEVGADILGPLDNAAVEDALSKVAAAGFDPDAVADLIIDGAQKGLFTDMQSKVATAMTPDQAVHVRALEILETVGFDIDWSKA